MNVELDVEKRLQALVAKDRIRIKEFFIDFDKLRKGVVGVAAVSIFFKVTNVAVTLILNKAIFSYFFEYSSEHASEPSTFHSLRPKSTPSLPSTRFSMTLLTMLPSVLASIMCFLIQ